MCLIKYIEIPTTLFTGIYQTGSTVICSPPVTNTDIDFIICTPEMQKLHLFLIDNGFKESSKDQEEYELSDDGFACYRKKNINLILTSNKVFYKRWVLATNVAKKLNLLNKKDRIILFKAILYREC